MTNFISSLYLYYSEQLPFPTDPGRLSVIDQYHTLEEQIEAAMGEDFLSMLQRAEHEKVCYELEEAFQLGLQVGIQLMAPCLGLNPPQSPAHSAAGPH